MNGSTLMLGVKLVMYYLCSVVRSLGGFAKRCHTGWAVYDEPTCDASNRGTVSNWQLIMVNASDMTKCYSDFPVSNVLSWSIWIEYYLLPLLHDQRWLSSCCKVSFASLAPSYPHLTVVFHLLVNYLPSATTTTTTWPLLLINNHRQPNHWSQ